MYAKLALRNVKRQVGNYLIYFMTVALTVALLFAISNVIFSENLEKFTSSREMRSGLVGMVVLISAIVAFVLRYATAFMLRLRKREFGTYLTLGMTRGDLLRIFLAETTWICLGALAVGLLLGLFLYQGLMVVMMHLLEMTFTIAAYSVKGLVLTIGLVLGIFLLASVTSAIYLKRVSIYELLHAEQKVEGTVQHAGFWFFMTVLSFCLMVGSPVAFYLDLERVLTIGRDAQSSMLWLMAFAVSVIVFHIGLARSIVFVLLRRKKFRSRSTNTFVLRQLSGTLRSSCVMLGFLAFLLTFTVVGANVAFVQKASQQAQLNRNCPYDIQYTENLDYEMTGDRPGQGIAQDVAEQTIASYVPILNSFSYQVYTSNDDFFHSQTRWSGEGY